MNVVDLGCTTHAFSPEDESTERLLERFQPEFYYGFDPHPSTPERKVEIREGTRIEIVRKAAWTYDGTVGLVLPPEVMNPLRTHVDEGGETRVECFDLNVFLYDRWPVVLKMDVEGAERVLLPRLFADEGAVSQVALLLIEWHGFPLSEIPCPWEEWA